MTRETILVVDDEPRIVKILEHALRTEGYRVLKATSGVEALTLEREGHPDLIILDLLMRGLDGYEVCRRVRAVNNTPIMVLSEADGESDKIEAFKLGADDYVTKPFRLRELLDRVDELLAKTRRDIALHRQDSRVVGELVIDHDATRVTLDGMPVTLTSEEFDLLWCLAMHPGRVFTRDQLLACLSDGESAAGRHAINQLVAGLRDKIEHDPAAPGLIETVRGVGYRFNG